jgi:hypothetical protein
VYSQQTEVLILPIKHNGQSVDDITLNGSVVNEVTVNKVTVYTSEPEPGIVYYQMDAGGPAEFYNLPSPYNVESRGSPTSTFSRSGRMDNIAIKNDGSIAYIAGSRSGGVDKLILDSPFNIGDVSQQTSITPPSTGFDEVTCFTFADTGSRFYQNNGSGDMVQFNLSSPYELGTAGGVTGQISFNTSDGPGDPAFSPDGLKMAFGGRGDSILISGSLSTPFDISTFTQEDTFTTQDKDPSCLKWNGDGTTAYIRHASPDMVNEFSTNTPYSVNGMSFTQQVFSDSEAGFAAGGHEFNKNH